MVKTAKQFNSFERLALAMHLDNSGGKCALCSYEYLDVDDAIKKDITCYCTQPTLIACRECYLGSLKRNLITKEEAIKLFPEKKNE